MQRGEARVGAQDALSWDAEVEMGRRMILGAGLVVVGTTVALGAVHAAPPVGTAGPAARPTVRPTATPTAQPVNERVFVARFRYVPPPTVTTPGGMVMTTTQLAGSYKYEFDVTNNTDAAVDTTLTATKTPPSGSLGASPPKWDFPIALAAHKSTTLSFTDLNGLPDGCSAFGYSFKFQGKPERKDVRVAPSCTFQVSSVGAPTSPQTTNVVYYEGARLRSLPKCNEKFDVAAYAVNSGTAHESYHVQLKIPFPGNRESNGPIPQGTLGNRYGRSAIEFISYPASSTPNKVALFTTQGDVFKGDEGDYPLTVVRARPPSNGGGPPTAGELLEDLMGGSNPPRTPIAPPSWTIRVKRTCSVVISPF